MFSSGPGKVHSWAYKPYRSSISRVPFAESHRNTKKESHCSVIGFVPVSNMQQHKCKPQGFGISRITGQRLNSAGDPRNPAAGFQASPGWEHLWVRRPQQDKPAKPVREVSKRPAVVLALNPLPPYGECIHSRYRIRIPHPADKRRGGSAS